jgi:hypothetical protein
MQQLTTLHMQTVAHTPYSVNELNVLKESFQMTGSMLANFIVLVELAEELSKDMKDMMCTVDQLQVPYNYEYLRLEYLEAFKELKEHLNELCHSMLYFPNEVESFLGYIKNEPTSHNHAELFGMLEATYRYYCAKYEVLKNVFNENKKLAKQSYEFTQMQPRPCGW